MLPRAIIFHPGFSISLRLLDITLFYSSTLESNDLLKTAQSLLTLDQDRLNIPLISYSIFELQWPFHLFFPSATHKSIFPSQWLNPIFLSMSYTGGTHPMLTFFFSLFYCSHHYWCSFLEDSVQDWNHCLTLGSLTFRSENTHLMWFL